MGARINTADDPSTSDKILVNFCPVTTEFSRHVCSGRATRHALPRISGIIRHLYVYTYCVMRLLCMLSRAVAVSPSGA